MYCNNICRNLRIEKNTSIHSNRLLGLLVEGRRSSTNYASSIICDHYAKNKPLPTTTATRSSLHIHKNNYYKQFIRKSSDSKEPPKEEELKENPEEEFKDPFPNVDVTINKDMLSEMRRDLQRQGQTLSNDDKINIEEYTKEVKVKMPDMENEPGRLVKWYKKEGDLINRGDLICDIKIESLSFTFGITSDDEGITIMGKQFVSENQTDLLNANDVMCVTWHKPMRSKKGDEDKETKDEE